jgi:hypothetical protein
MSTTAPQSSSQARTLLRSATPVVTLGATWVVRKGMMKGYEAGTGRKAPLVRSRDASLVEKMLWAATMAAVVVLVEAVIWRMLEEDRH